jgi:mannose-6-phosphate isomerase-like protein (cupin superfamily)
MFPNSYFQSLRTVFSGNIRPILNELEQYNADELFYRRCYELRNNEHDLTDFLAAFGPDKIEKRHLINPQEIKKMGTIKFDEDIFFYQLNPSKDRNVILYKHNRYSPLFVHYHNFFEIFFVLTGQCTNTILNNQIVLPMGNLCFIAPNVNHVLGVFDDSIIINILIRKSTFDEIFFNLLINNDILSEFFLGNLYLVRPIDYIRFDIGDDIEMMEQFFAMLIEQTHNDKYSDRIMNHQLSIFFSLLVRKYGKDPIVHEHSNPFKKRHWDTLLSGLIITNPPEEAEVRGLWEAVVC